MNNPLLESYDSILGQLYSGEVFPAEQITPFSNEYKEASKNLKTLLNEITGIIAEATNAEKSESLLYELESLINDRCSLDCRENFIFGFKLGARMIIETLGDPRK